jgi:hypothetical protein
MNAFRFLILSCLIGITISCSDKNPHFTVEGKISDADSTTLYLEKRELNKTSILDSVKLNKEGTFKFTEISPEYPEFYVLRINGQIINLSIDSIETIKIEASKKSFATDYTIENSAVSEQLKTITLAQYKATQSIIDYQEKFKKREINETEYLTQIQIIDSTYKDIAKKVIFSDLKSPAAYFALFQKVGDLLFFDPYDKQDYKVFAAVATAWDVNYPASPRTKQLKDFTLQAMKVRKQSETAPLDIENLNSISSDQFFNIELPDVNNNMVNLSSLKGKVILLDFTVYQAEESPAHNIALNQLYNKYKDNLQIYQVSLDADTHFWKNAASNIPWIAVHEIQSINSPLIGKFNVQQLPSMYLLNKNGEMVKRVFPGDNIDNEIQKLL